MLDVICDTILTNCAKAHYTDGVAISPYLIHNYLSTVHLKYKTSSTTSNTTATYHELGYKIVSSPIVNWEKRVSNSSHIHTPPTNLGYLSPCLNPPSSGRISRQRVDIATPRQPPSHPLATGAPRRRNSTRIPAPVGELLTRLVAPAEEVADEVRGRVGRRRPRERHHRRQHVVLARDVGERAAERADDGVDALQRLRPGRAEVGEGVGREDAAQRLVVVVVDR